MWKGITPPPFPDTSSIGPSSVCQLPFGMKQNCSDADSRIVESSDDNTSFTATPPASGGFSDKRSGIAAKYTPAAGP